MEILTLTHWFLLALGSLIMGMSKGGLPGAGNLTVAIYALVLEDALGPVGVPLSVGLLLPVLISADLTATLVYRKHTDWKFIIRLLPCFIIGTILGWWVFDYFQGGDEKVRQLKYVIGGILTLKISNKKNENVTASILIWGVIFLIPITAYTEQPWNLTPSTASTISVIYLGIFATGIAWLLRFRILKNNGLVFQAQVAYLIPIFGIILGYIFLNELITPKVIVAVIAVVVGIYFVKKSNIKKITSI